MSALRALSYATAIAIALVLLSPVIKVLIPILIFALTIEILIRAVRR
jgi:hypothetical protein